MPPAALRYLVAGLRNRGATTIGDPTDPDRLRLGGWSEPENAAEERALARSSESTSW